VYQPIAVPRWRILPNRPTRKNPGSRSRNSLRTRLRQRVRSTTLASSAVITDTTDSQSTCAMLGGATFSPLEIGGQPFVALDLKPRQPDW